MIALNKGILDGSDLAYFFSSINIAGIYINNIAINEIIEITITDIILRIKLKFLWITFLWTIESLEQARFNQTKRPKIKIFNFFISNFSNFLLPSQFTNFVHQLPQIFLLFPIFVDFRNFSLLFQLLEVVNHIFSRCWPQLFRRCCVNFLHNLESGDWNFWVG